MLSNENGDRNSSFLTGEEVVISGISGVFPNSNNVVEFMDNLYNKVNMVGDFKSRWVFKHPDLPEHMGTVQDMHKFDAQFFRVQYKQANVMEPMSRKLLEHVYSAIYDAGVNPVSLKKTKVGMYIASAFTGSESMVIYEEIDSAGFTLAGVVKAMFANRISYWMDSNAPSYATDLGCASALACLQHAYRSINSGECEAAIVGGANFCNHPAISISLRRLGLLCLDGKTKCFDKNGDGYVRSDAVNVFFLQKAKHAKRIYCEVFNVQGCYKLLPTERFLPIREVDCIKEYLESFYSTIAVDPNDVEYVEGSGVGIAEADSNELEAIGQVYGRKHPIKVGSVKSNMGNSEAASALCSLTKLCLAYHRGQLPSNLHYTDPFDIPSVQDGCVQVLTDNTDFNRGFTAINSFSFTGTTYHALLKGHYKEKNNDRYKSQIPYLILTSGRQESGMALKLNLLRYHTIDPEFIGLLHNIYQTDTPQHVYRGYTILDSDYKGRTSSLAESYVYYNNMSGPVVFVYSGLGSSWPTLSLKLMNVPIFAESMQRSHKILESKGFDLMSLLTDSDINTNADIMDVMIGVTAMQIAFTDLLFKLGIVPDLILGHSMGDIACGYADGSLTAEQVLLSNYIRIKFWKDVHFMHGAMIVIGLGYTMLKKLCPPGIEVVCHNSPKSSTITGPCEVTRRFANELKSSGIYVMELDLCNVPIHSTYVSHFESLLTKRLEEVIKDPKPRSPKWLSSTVPERLWHTNEAKLSSAEYHTRNLLEPVYFEETAKRIPTNAVIIEIGAHGQMKSILKQCNQEATYISLSKRGHNDPVKFLLESIGRLYEVGVTPNISVLYPAIEYPVSTKTPFLSHFVEWEHSEDWLTNVYQPKQRITSKSQTFVISAEDDDYAYIQGNIRNGKNVFPEASLLIFVWNTLAMYHNMDYRRLSVVFDKVQFHDEVIIEANKVLKFYVAISKGNDKFEVTYENKIIVSGIIRCNVDPEQVPTNISNIKEEIILTKRDVYKLFHLRGYSYNGDFRTIESTTIPVQNANVAWVGEWATFLDSLIQLNVLARDHNGVSILKYIHKIIIDVEENSKLNEVNGESVTYYPVQLYNNYEVTRCGGVLMENIFFIDKPVLEEPRIINNNVDIYYTGLPIQRNEMNGQLFDYSGISESLGRVMGVCFTTDENNSMRPDPDLIWPVPEYWSLEDAATVPVPYLYAFYCLTIRSSLYENSSVLVTDGIKALGQAVISLCLAFNYTVYTTVSNTEDKLLLMQLFPELKEENIGNSQDGTFLDMIKYNTEQEGCDLVINTFNGILKQQATQCVRGLGCVLTINNYENTQYTDLEMAFLDLARSYKIIDLPNVFITKNTEEKKILHSLISEGIAKGMVRPLPRVVYKATDDARTLQLHLSSDTQRGRVLVNMIDVNNHVDNICERLDFGKNGYYVIICDDSELGIALAEYLIKQGVNKIILHTSVDGFVQLKLRYWKKQGISVNVCFESLQTIDGCEKMFKIKENAIIEGIFIINNCDVHNTGMNKTSNSDSVRNNLKNLDVVSKNVCSGLRYYVIISHGSKDDFENKIISTCDMICEGRRKIGLPALHYITGLLNRIEDSNEIQLNVNLMEISDVYKDLEKSIKSKEVKTNFLKENDERKHNNVTNVKEEFNNRFNMGLGTFYKYIETDECSGTDILVKMPTKIPSIIENEHEFDSCEPYLLMIPGFDGSCHIFKSLCERLKIPALVIQLTPDLNYQSVKTIASDIMKLLSTQIQMKTKFYILGYSFGVNVALELAALFEQKGHVGVVYCLDSSPEALRKQFQAYVGNLSDGELQELLLNHMHHLIANESNDLNFENMEWSEKLKRVLDKIKSSPCSNEYKKLVIETAYKKIMLALDYKPGFVLESELILLKGIPHPKAAGLTRDYNLSKYTECHVKIFEISSDFASAPEDCKIASIVHRTLDPELLEELKGRNLCETYLL